MDKRSFLSINDKRILGGIEYEINRLVGCGASTIVYEAYYKDALNQDYVHKVLIKELYPYDEYALIHRDAQGCLCWPLSLDSMMEDHRYFFRRGNEMNIRLLEKNPGTVSGNLNSFEAYGTYYSVLPLHGGETLEKYMTDGRKYTLKEAAAIQLQILDALRLFHENGLLNLDISPDNILILEGRVMFIDYNSVWDMKDAESDCYFSQKEGYTAPEILLQEFDEIGYSSDLYSVSAVFYEMLFGEIYQMKNRGWEKIAEKVASKLKETWSESTQKEICHILRKGLHPLSEKRYQSVEEYESHLKDFLAQIEAEEKDDQVSKIKYIVGGMTGLILALLLILGGKYLLEEKPWLPHIISQGNTNANLYNKARFCLADQQYEYYIDKDGNLRMCDYDQEDHSFDPTKARIAYQQDDSLGGDGVDFLNLGTDLNEKANKVYFTYYGGENRSDSVMCMDINGKNPQVLFSHEQDKIGDYYSYVHLSDDREYIYYMEGVESEPGVADDYAIYRYDIKKKENELLIDTKIQWFNLYKKHIYYIEYDYEKESYQLMKASVDGKNPKLIDEKNQFIGGFVQDDHMYLERYLEEEYSIQSCDLNGKILYDQQGVYGLELSNVEIGYDDGWIYYSKEGEKELRKVRLDGTADKLIHQGWDCYGMNVIGNYLFLSVSDSADEEFLSNDAITEDYMIERNGENYLKVR